jgi:hypothetical protein
MAKAIPSHVVRELAGQLDTVRGRARAALKRDFIRLYGCSPSTLSRALCEVGLRSHCRADAGTRRVAVTDDDLMKIAVLQKSSESLRKGVIMPAEDAIDIAEENGLVPANTVRAGYYNAWLREKGGSRIDQQQAAPHIQLRSLGPNHVHQVDFSLAVNWKIFQGKLAYEHLIYKNKLPEAGIPRLWRLIVVDHATGCLFPFYAESTGETVQVLLEGLYRAWTEKQLRGQSIKQIYPFRGVPQILMADRGSANRAGITIHLLQRLGIKLNICEGARSKGTVEVSHNFWEQHFESRMRLHPPSSVEQLNEWAIDFAVRYCGQETHSRYCSQRSLMWAWHINRKPETQLRELTCNFETFKSIAVSEPQKALVNGARIIRFKGKKYRVPNDFLPGEHVSVQYSPYQFPRIQVRAWDVPTSPSWVCEPVELDEFGFAVDGAVIGQQYKSHKKTETARFADTAAAAAKELVEAQQIRAFGYHAAKVDPIEIKHEAAEVPLPNDVSIARMTRIQARQEVQQILGRPFTPPEAQYINDLFGAEVTESEIASAVAEIQRGITSRVLDFPAVGVNR